MTKNKLYIILSAACVAGYSWLIINYLQQGSHVSEPGICLFKRITTIPCPSCGSTRSVVSLLKGDVAQALYLNPLGVLLVSALLIVPFWILFDLTSRKESLLNAYVKAEQFFRLKWVAIPAIFIVIVNWIWNIHKGL